jgi:hypothetical protein
MTINLSGVEEGIRAVRTARRIGVFSKTVEEPSEEIIKKLGAGVEKVVSYERNNVLKIYCGVVRYAQRDENVEAMLIQNIDPEARLDDLPIRDGMMQGIGAIVYKIPELTLDMTIEEVRGMYNVEHGFLVGNLSYPVFERRLKAPITRDEITQGLIDVDRAGEAWIRRRGALDSEMAGAYRAMFRS